MSAHPLKHFEVMRKIVKDKFCVAITVIVLLELLSGTQTAASHAVIIVSSPDVNETVGGLNCEYEKNTAKVMYDDVPLEIRGEIVNAVPVNACEIVKTPPKSLKSHTWILLTSRADCDFNTKIIHAQNSGYSALLVYDDASNSTNPMSIQSKYYNKYTVELSENMDGMNWGRIVILSLVIALLFLALACCFCMTWICLSVACPRFRDSLRIFARERRRSKRNQIFIRNLKQSPTQKWTPNLLSESCAICMDEFQLDSDLRVLNCNHGFHPECIDEWLVHGRRFCPLCGRKVVLPNQHLFANSDSETEDDTSPLLSNPHTTIRPYGNNLNPQRRENPFLRGNASQAEEVQTVPVPAINTNGNAV